MADDLLGKIGEAFVLLRADGSKLSDDIKKEKAALEKKLNDLGGGLKKFGTAMSAGLTAPLVALGAAAVHAGVVIDDAYDTIRTSTGKTGDELVKLQKNFDNVFKKVPDDAAVVATALSDVHKRTGQTGEGLQDLTKNILDLSRATKTDVSANVQQATRLFGDWSIATDKQSSALDYVFKVSQKTGVGVTDLMGKLVQFGAPLRQFNFSFEESAALMGKWEKEGVNTELVLGSLRIAMGKFAAANVPLRDGLEKTFDTIKKLGPGAEATSVAMKVFGARAGPDMAAAILEGRFAIQDLIRDVSDSKETIASATRDTEGFAEGWKRFRNQMTIALEPLGTKLLEIGERALPVLEKMGNTAIAVAEAFERLPRPVQDFIIGAAAVTAAVGPAIYVLGSLITSATTIIGLGAKIATAMGITGAAGGITAAGTAAGVAAPRVALLGASFTTLGIAIAGLGLVALARQLREVDEALPDAERLRAKSMTPGGSGLWTEVLRIPPGIKEDYESQLRALYGHLSRVEIEKQKARETNKQVTQSSQQVAGAESGTAKAQKDALLAQLGLNKGREDGKDKALEAAKAVEKLREAEDSLAQAAGRTVARAVDPRIAADKEWRQSRNEEGIRQMEEDVRRMDREAAEWRRYQNEMGEMEIRAHEEAIREKEKADAEYRQFRNEIGIRMMEDDAKRMEASKSMLSKIFAGFGSEDFGKGLGDIILKAFTGGGDIAKSVGGFIGNKIGDNIGGSLSKSLSGFVSKNIGGMFGKTVGSVLGSVIPGLGTFLGGMLGDFISKGLGKILGKIGQKFKDWFGGPSEKELKGREEASTVRGIFMSSLNEEQRKQLEQATGYFGDWRGNESGAATVIALRDAFLAIGRTEEEALQWADRLFKAEKLGPTEVRKVAEQIKAIVGDRIPGFATGGAGFFGMGRAIMAHGYEAIMPMDKLEGLLLKKESSTIAQLADAMFRKGGGLEKLLGMGTEALSRLKDQTAIQPRGLPLVESAGLTAEKLADAIVRTGIGKRNIIFQPTFDGTLDHEMKHYVRTQMWPTFIQVLRESGELRVEVASTIHAELGALING